jgi:hypothetical protein
MARLPEHKENLWWLTVSPVIWGAHFLASYITVAVWCAKVVPPAGPLDGARWAVLVYTAVALLGVAGTMRHAWRRHRYGESTAPHDFDTPEDRHRFLGFAALLLSGLSAVAIVFDTLPVLFLGSCQ